MPTSGPVVHRQLIQAYQEAQHELETARGEIAAAGAELGELGAGRGDMLLDLARHYLPELTPAAVEKTWSDARHWIYEILQRKQNHVAKLDRELILIATRRTDAERELASVTASLDEATLAQQLLAQAVSDALAADTDFSNLSNRAAQAEASLQRAEANLQEIEQDSLKKLPSYENSALFMYLKNRHFATADYQHRGITRNIDQWLSRYIGYREARQGYDFLKSTPQQMREVIARDRQSLDLVLDDLEKRRDTVAQRMGLPDAIETVQSLSAQRSTWVERLDQIQRDTQTLQSDRSRIDDSRGPYYQEAIEKFRRALDILDSRTLADRAKQTAEIEDDLIVARLQGLQIEMQQVNDQVSQRQKKVASLTDHLQSIGALINRYRAAGFDTGRAIFNSSLDVTSELRMARDGGGNFEAVWHKIRGAHRWGATAMDQVTQVATHPMTQVLINAMAHAAAGAMQAQARDAGRRRASGQSRTSQRTPPPSPPSLGGGGGGGYRGGSGGGGFKNRGGF
jgi:chromosome segregation ATPase